LILASFKEPVSILIDNRLFKVPLFGKYLKKTGHIPVIPEQGYSAFEAARRLLEEGRTVIIFPEGTISPLSGGLNPPRTGAARLALLTGAPIVPAGIYLERRRLHLIKTRIDGKDEIGTWYLNGPFAVTYGQPMWFQGDVEDREYVASVSKRLMRRIAQLTFESAYRVMGMQALAAIDSGELVIL
jgi:1-acyl-sn-glycerol-3-phosphate acyltransferase